MKRIITVLLMISVVASAMLVTSCGTMDETTTKEHLPSVRIPISNETLSDSDEKEDETVFLVDAEIVNGKLILFYSDGTTKDSEIVIDSNEGEQLAELPITASCLSFYPLNDSEYGVKMGDSNSYVEELTIPAMYNEIPVTTIFTLAFTSSNSSSLKTVVVPNTVRRIEGRAFYSCVKSIVYQGSMEEWNNIEMYANSFESIYGGTIVIHCTDGDVLIER